MPWCGPSAASRDKEGDSPSRTTDVLSGITKVKIAFLEVDPVTKAGGDYDGDNIFIFFLFPATGQRLYMVHMLLLPFLPITALIVQVSCDWRRVAVLTSDWSRTAAPW